MIVEKFSKITEELERPPYRFKTEQEFIQEFGPSWRNIYFNLGTEHCFTFTNGMDYLFGKEVDKEYFYDYDFPEEREFTSCVGGWSIGRKFIKNNRKIVPNYQPRKINRTLETIKIKKYIE